MNTNLAAYLLQADPAAAALETEPETCWCYGDLDRGSARFAAALTDAGIRRGGRVAVLARKSPSVMLLYLACLRSGAVFVPISADFPPPEMLERLRDAEPGLVICDPAAEPALAAGLAAFSFRPRLMTLDAGGGGSLPRVATAAANQTDIVDATADDPAVLLFTSGTTGRPKAAVLTHGNLAANAEALNDTWGMRSDDVLLHVLPLDHAHGLLVAVNCTLLAGARMRFQAGFDAARACAALPHCTVMMGVPTQYRRLLALPEFGADTCRRMRLFVSGSAPLRESDFEAFRIRTGHSILERYGMTETVMNCSNPLRGERRPGSVGLPLPGVSVRVTGADGLELAPDTAGNLEVAGPNVFAGYWRHREVTAAAFTDDGYFRTGDIARIGPDGYVTLVGRARELIISGGLNVYPREVERVLDSVAGLQESAVFGLPHPDFGEAVVAAVVAEEAAAEADILAACREQLAGFQLPKRLFRVDTLPRNAMGKVRKDQLAARYADTFTKSALEANPNPPLQHIPR